MPKFAFSIFKDLVVLPPQTTGRHRSVGQVPGSTRGPPGHPSRVWEVGKGRRTGRSPTLPEGPGLGPPRPLPRLSQGPGDETVGRRRVTLVGVTPVPVRGRPFTGWSGRTGSRTGRRLGRV